MTGSIQTEMSREQLARAYLVARRGIDWLREQNLALGYAAETWRDRVRNLEEDFGISAENRWTT